MSWSATVLRVRDTARPMGQRVTALHSLVSNHHAPLGFLGTRARLRKAAGVGLLRRWTEPRLLEALRVLEESRASHLRYRAAFAQRRRREKAEGWRRPTTGDVAALDRVEWLKDVEEARRRHPPVHSPSERIREVVAGFLKAKDLLPLIDVEYGRAADGGSISLKPRAEGAADLVVRTAGHPDSFVVYVFVAGDARPIEIAGPINGNTEPPFRSAEKDLLEVLHLVSRGEVFDEVDEKGNVTGTDVPDPRTAIGPVDGGERRRWFEPWA